MNGEQETMFLVTFHLFEHLLSIFDWSEIFLQGFFILYLQIENLYDTFVI